MAQSRKNSCFSTRECPLDRFEGREESAEGRGERGGKEEAGIGLEKERESERERKRLRERLRERLRLSLREIERDRGGESWRD